MKKSILIIISIIALISCTRKKEPIDTEGGIVFGQEDIDPSLKAPCSQRAGTYTIGTYTESFETPFVNNVSNGYSIWAEDIYNSSVTILLSQKPTKFPDTLRIDGNVKTSTYIKNISFEDYKNSRNYYLDYSLITTPNYLYINKVGNKINYQICALPMYYHDFSFKYSTLSINLSTEE